MKLTFILLASLVRFIVTAPGEDASRQVNVNWHSYVAGSYMELACQADSSFADALRIYPREELWSLDCGDSLFACPRYVCRVNLDKLEPGTGYMYRVHAGDQVGETCRFVTADGSSDWTFTAFTDFQPQSNPFTHNIMRVVDSLAVNPLLSVCSGDMVDMSVNQNEWEWLLDGRGSQVFRNVLYASSPGDHEYWGLRSGKHYHQLETPMVYRSIFNFPANGAECCPGSCYWFIYNNVLFVSLDTGDSNTPVSDKVLRQRDWFLAKVKELKGRYDFLVVFQHKSVQGSYTNDPGVNSRLKPVLAPAYAEAGVDLVLSGHDHMYSRTRCLDGVWYLDMGSSGSKTRVPDEGIYSDGLHEKIINLRETGQCMGAVVRVSGDRMEVGVYDGTATLVDSFTVCKH